MLRADDFFGARAVKSVSCQSASRPSVSFIPAEPGLLPGGVSPESGGNEVELRHFAPLVTQNPVQIHFILTTSSSQNAPFQTHKVKDINE